MDQEFSNEYERPVAYCQLTDNFEQIIRFCVTIGAVFDQEGTTFYLVRFPGRPIDHYTWHALQMALQNPPNYLGLIPKSQRGRSIDMVA